MRTALSGLERRIRLSRGHSRRGFLPLSLRMLPLPVLILLRPLRQFIIIITIQLPRIVIRRLVHSLYLHILPLCPPDGYLPLILRFIRIAHPFIM